MKLDISKVDLTNTNQKIVAGLLLGGALGLLYYLLPPLVTILKNLWIAAILAIPIIFAVMNPMLIWNIFKQVSWNLTKSLISGDKLGYMYRYHEYILGKIEGLSTSVQTISAIRIKLQRKIGELQTKVNQNKAQAVVFTEKASPPTVIRALANQINIDSKQIETLLPKVVNVEKQERYLQELHDHWKADAQDLKYTLDAKADEYRLLKELSDATGNASEFLKGNTEEYKIYQESLTQIEDSVTKYTANVEDFERKVRPMLDNLSMGRTVSEDEGLKLIEDFKRGIQGVTFDVKQLSA